MECASSPRTPWSSEGGEFDLVDLVVELRDDSTGQAYFLNKRPRPESPGAWHIFRKIVAEKVVNTGTGETAWTIREVLSEADFPAGVRCHVDDAGQAYFHDAETGASRLTLEEVLAVRREIAASEKGPRRRVEVTTQTGGKTRRTLRWLLWSAIVAAHVLAALRATLEVPGGRRRWAH